MMQRVVPGSLVAGSSTAGSTNVIKKLVYKVSSVSGATATVIAATGFSNNDFPVKGDDFVRIGNTGTPSRQGTIYLTSDDSNAPYMDVKDNIDSYGDWHDASTTKVRVGNLSGITDAGLNAGSSLSGYGLYGGNVFLKPVKREQFFLQLLEGLHEDEAEVICLMKDKKLTDKYKLTKSVVSEAFPDIEWGGRGA